MILELVSDVTYEYLLVVQPKEFNGGIFHAIILFGQAVTALQGGSR